MHVVLMIVDEVMAFFSCSHDYISFSRGPLFIIELELHFVLDVVFLSVIVLNVNLSLGSLDWDIIFFWWASNWFRSYELVALIGPVVSVNPQPLALKLDVDRVLCFQEPVNEMNAHLRSPRISRDYSLSPRPQC